MIKRFSMNKHNIQMKLLESTSEVVGYGYALNLAGGDIEVLTGKESKGPVSDGKLPAQRLARIDLGTMYSKQYNQQLEVNPLLIDAGSVQFVRMFEPSEVNPIRIYFTPRTNFDISELEYVVRVYIID